MVVFSKKFKLSSYQCCFAGVLTTALAAFLFFFFFWLRLSWTKGPWGLRIETQFLTYSLFGPLWLTVWWLEKQQVQLYSDTDNKFSIPVMLNTDKSHQVRKSNLQSLRKRSSHFGLCSHQLCWFFGLLSYGTENDEASTHLGPLSLSNTATIKHTFLINRKNTTTSKMVLDAVAGPSHSRVFFH